MMSSTSTTVQITLSSHRHLQPLPRLYRGTTEPVELFDLSDLQAGVCTRIPACGDPPEGFSTGDRDDLVGRLGFCGSRGSLPRSPIAERQEQNCYQCRDRQPRSSEERPRRILP